jgi:hypothetical protein
VAALAMIEPHADRAARDYARGKACDSEDFVNELRAMSATPHVALNADDVILAEFLWIGFF